MVFKYISVFINVLINTFILMYLNTVFNLFCMYLNSLFRYFLVYLNTVFNYFLVYLNTMYLINWWKVNIPTALLKVCQSHVS